MNLINLSLDYHNRFEVCSQVKTMKPFLMRLAIFIIIICVSWLYCTRSLLSPDEQAMVIYKNTIDQDLKHILLWTRRDYAPFYNFDNQEKFALSHCPLSNCFVTADRNFFGGNITKFDAVMFNGRNIDDIQIKHIPRRSPDQKFIYVNTESSANSHRRIHERIFFGFFNWTMTYRLDSDIPYPYIVVRNKTGHIVGPKLNMEWENNMEEVDKSFIKLLQNKKKAAAWFVSDCNTLSKRELYVKSLDAELRKNSYNVDIFGKCGKLNCPRKDQEKCDKMLQNDYFFYLAFENSFAEDYVTEKLVRGLNFNTVPIVFGSANYSRFLPPGSYLNAMKISPAKMAAIMTDLMKNQNKYYQYFKWKNHYIYSSEDPMARENICSLCSALNNKTKMRERTVYYELSKWWLK